MSKTGLVYYNGILAGRLKMIDGAYVFTYETTYLADPALPPIAIAFPKSRRDYRSPALFPFFFGLLAEGANKRLQCASLKIDESDHFTRLLGTAGDVTIGAITVKEAA